jgi:hypothetical protein
MEFENNDYENIELDDDEIEEFLYLFPDMKYLNKYIIERLKKNKNKYILNKLKASLNTC